MSFQHCTSSPIVGGPELPHEVNFYKMFGPVTPNDCSQIEPAILVKFTGSYRQDTLSFLLLF